MHRCLRVAFNTNRLHIMWFYDEHTFMMSTTVYLVEKSHHALLGAKIHGSTLSKFVNRQLWDSYYPSKFSHTDNTMLHTRSSRTIWMKSLSCCRFMSDGNQLNHSASLGLDRDRLTGLQLGELGLGQGGPKPGGRSSTILPPRLCCLNGSAGNLEGVVINLHLNCSCVCVGCICVKFEVCLHTTNQR